MNRSQISELKTDYLHLTVGDFYNLLRHIGQTANSASKALGRNRHYIAQMAGIRTKVPPILIEQYKNIIGKTVFFDGYAAILEKREELEKIRRARINKTAETL